MKRFKYKNTNKPVTVLEAVAINKDYEDKYDLWLSEFESLFVEKITKRTTKKIIKSLKKQSE